MDNAGSSKRARRVLHDDDCDIASPVVEIKSEDEAIEEMVRAPAANAPQRYLPRVTRRAPQTTATPDVNVNVNVEEERPLHRRAGRDAHAADLAKLKTIEDGVSTMLLYEWPIPTAACGIEEITRRNMESLGVLNASPERVKTAFAKVVESLHVEVDKAAVAANKCGLPDERPRRVLEMVQIIVGRIKSVEERYVADVAYVNGRSATESLTRDIREDILNSKDVKSIHRILLHVLSKAQAKNLRKLGADLFEERLHEPRGGPPRRTGAWKLHMSIKEFIYKACNKQEHPDMWLLMVSTPISVLEEIIKCGDDVEIATLSVHRHIFASYTGLYNLNENRFIPAADISPTEDSVACAFLKQDFPVEATTTPDWFDIPTPIVDRILRYQAMCRPWNLIFDEDRALLTSAGMSVGSAEEMFHVDNVDSLLPRHDDPVDGRDDVMDEAERMFSDTERLLEATCGENRPISRRERALVRLERECVIRDFYMFVGRLYFPVGQHDDMQAMLYINGKGGTGKGTLSNLIMGMYPQHLVAILPSRVEVQFGLEALLGKYMCACLEVKKEFQLDQSNLQSMITGESVSVSMKFKTAQTVKHWTTSLLMMGNGWGPWEDTKGCMSRRLVNFMFQKSINETHQDGSLKDQIKAERAHFLVKCVRAYLERAKDLDTNTKGVYTRIHPYFRWTRQLMQADLCPVVRFFQSGRCQVAPGRYMSIKDLRAALTNEGTALPVERLRRAVDNQTNESIQVGYVSLPYNNAVVRDEFVRGVGFADRFPDQAIPVAGGIGDD